MAPRAGKRGKRPASDQDNNSHDIPGTSVMPSAAGQASSAPRQPVFRSYDQLEPNLLFANSAEAEAYKSPKIVQKRAEDEDDLKAIEADLRPYVIQVFNAMVDTSNIKDNASATAVTRFTRRIRKTGYYSTERMLATAWKLTDLALHCARHGYNYPPLKSFLALVKSDGPQLRARLQQVCDALKTEKATAIDMLEQDSERMEVFLSAPKAFAKLKVKNRVCNERKKGANQKNIAREQEPARQRETGPAEGLAKGPLTGTPNEHSEDATDTDELGKPRDNEDDGEAQDDEEAQDAGDIEDPEDNDDDGEVGDSNETETAAPTEAGQATTQGQNQQTAEQARAYEPLYPTFDDLPPQQKSMDLARAKQFFQDRANQARMAPTFAYTGELSANPISHVRHIYNSIVDVSEMVGGDKSNGYKKFVRKEGGKRGDSDWSERDILKAAWRVYDILVDVSTNGMIKLEKEITRHENPLPHDTAPLVRLDKVCQALKIHKTVCIDVVANGKLKVIGVLVAPDCTEKMKNAHKDSNDARKKTAAGTSSKKRTGTDNSLGQTDETAATGRNKRRRKKKQDAQEDTDPLTGSPAVHLGPGHTQAMRPLPPPFYPGQHPMILRTPEPLYPASYFGPVGQQQHARTNQWGFGASYSTFGGALGAPSNNNEVFNTGLNQPSQQQYVGNPPDGHPYRPYSTHTSTAGFSNSGYTGAWQGNNSGFGGDGNSSAYHGGQTYGGQNLLAYQHPPATHGQPSGLAHYQQDTGAQQQQQQDHSNAFQQQQAIYQMPPLPPLPSGLPASAPPPAAPAPAPAALAWAIDPFLLTAQPGDVVPPATAAAAAATASPADPSAQPPQKQEQGGSNSGAQGVGHPGAQQAQAQEQLLPLPPVPAVASTSRTTRTRRGRGRGQQGSSAIARSVAESPALEFSDNAVGGGDAAADVAAGAQGQHHASEDVDDDAAATAAADAAPATADTDAPVDAAGAEPREDQSEGAEAREQPE